MQVFLCKPSLLGMVIMVGTLFCINIVFPIIYLAVIEKFLNNKKTKGIQTAYKINLNYIRLVKLHNESSKIHGHIPDLEGM